MFRVFVALLLCVSCSYAQQATGQSPVSDTQSYVLKTGDRVDISYTYTPELNQSLLVGPDGTIGLTRVGPVAVAGLTMQSARAKITAAAARSGLNKPELFLNLTDYVRPQFTVLGEVTKPGRYDLRGNVRVADALAMAGGLTANARHRNLILVHPVDDTTGVTTLIDYRELEKTKGVKNFEEMQPGDIIVVPTGNLSKVERFIKLINVGIFYNPIP
jgi:protein involved in polysaccharide export with SLBB domain